MNKTEQQAATRLFALLSDIPQEEAHKIMSKAAAISGTPAEDVTDALQILADQSADTQDGAELNQIARQAEYFLLHGDNADKKMSQLEDAAKTGNLLTAFISIANDITQDAQDDSEAQDAIDLIINTGFYPGYKDSLNPASDEFNPNEYEAAIERAGGVYAVIAKIDRFAGADTMRDILNTYKENIAKTASTFSKDNIDAAFKAVRSVADQITKIINSPAYKEAKEKLDAINLYIDEHEAELAEFGELTAKQKLLIPFIKQELEEAKANPEYQNYSIIDILKAGFDSEGQPTDSVFSQLIKRARARLREFEATEGAVLEIEKTSGELTAAAAEIPQIMAYNSNKLSYPLDRPNAVIWDLIGEAATGATNGQFKIDTSREGHENEALIYYGINFDELENIKSKKRLTPFDKRVYIAVGALHNAGNEIISTNQIYAYMGGGKTNPSARDKEKINDSLTKMGFARIYLDNLIESKVYKGYTRFKYDAPLLPFERVSAYINGKLSNDAIRLFREPPLISFARQRKQITTIERRLLESPQSKTDENLRIEDYLIDRISHMKNQKKLSRKITYLKIYENCRITTKDQRRRAPGKIRNLLDFYIKCDWIKGFTESEDGITILL